MAKEQSLQQMVLGKRNIRMQKTEIGCLSYTMHKKSTQSELCLNQRPVAIKLLKKTQGEKIFLTLVLVMHFLIQH